MIRSVRRLALMGMLLPALLSGQARASTGVKKPNGPSAQSLPFAELTEREREMVEPIVARASLAARGPAEKFQADPRHYRYFLDHPDRAVSAWRRLGAKCVSITPREQGAFGWADEQGSELVWRTVHRGPGVRMWHAEGKVKPGPLLPAVPVKAVVVLRFHESQTPGGATVIHHQADLFVQTDSKTAALMTRLMGPTALRAAEQGLGQLQLFFSGLCWYLERHPEREEKLLKLE